MVTASNKRKRRDERREGNLAYQASVRVKCKLLPYHLHSMQMTAIKNPF